MVDREYIELMHLEIDGLISANDRQRLHRYLEAHPEAQQLFDKLHKVCHLLDKVEEVEPVEDLRERILGRIDFDRYVKEVRARARPNPLKSLLNTWTYRPRFRYAYAFSAGLVLGLLVSFLLFAEVFEQASVKPSQVSGTVVSQAGEWQVLQRLVIDEDAVRGVVVLRRSGRLLQLDVTLQTSGPITLTLQKPAQTGLEGFQRVTGRVTSLEIDTGKVQVTSDAATRYRLSFETPTHAVPEMTLTLLSSGTTLYKSILSASQGGIHR